MTDQDPFDDRLRGYLRQRSDVPPPDDLVANALARRQLEPRRTGSRFRVLFGVFAVVVAVLIIGSRVLAPFINLAGPQATAGPMLPTPSPSAIASATPAFPTSVLGFPVHTVPQARALIADGAHAGRAIAVAGWWSASAEAMSCPAAIEYTSAIENYCGLSALAADDTQVSHMTQTGNAMSFSFKAPDGALQPKVVSDTAGGGQPSANIGDLDQIPPQPVVVIGHTGDARALQCTAPQRADCDGDFVLDAFAWVDGRTISPVWNVADTAMKLSPAAAHAAALAALPPGSTVLSIGPWTSDQSDGLDPRLTLNVPANVSSYWFARASTGSLDSDGTTAETLVVVDDATGKTSTLPAAVPSGDQPAVLRFERTGDFQDETFIAVKQLDSHTPFSTQLQFYSTVPAVLGAGNYTVISWSGAGGLPAPSDAACRLSLAVSPGSDQSLTIDWATNGTCSITASP